MAFPNEKILRVLVVGSSKKTQEIVIVLTQEKIRLYDLSKGMDRVGTICLDTEIQGHFVFEHMKWARAGESMVLLHSQGVVKCFKIMF